MTRMHPDSPPGFACTGLSESGDLGISGNDHTRRSTASRTQTHVYLSKAPTQQRHAITGQHLLTYVPDYAA